MTTLDGVLTSEVEATAVPSRHVWRRLLAGFVLGFVLTLAVAGGALVAYDASFEGRVLAGVGVGDTRVGIRPLRRWARRDPDDGRTGCRPVP